MALKNRLVGNKVEDKDEDIVVSLSYTLYRNDDLVAETAWGDIKDDEKDMIRIATFYHLVNSGQTSGVIIEAIKEITTSNMELREKAIQVVQIWEYLKNYEAEEETSTDSPLISPSSALTADSKHG